MLGLMGPKLEGKVSARLQEPSWVSPWVPVSHNHKATHSLSVGPCVSVSCGRPTRRQRWIRRRRAGLALESSSPVPFEGLHLHWTF